MRFDATGKVSLDDIYTRPDPRTYFRQLRGLDYCVPQEAKPYFEKFIKEYRDSEQVEVPQVLDIGCSYGINAALLKYGLTMDELYTRYGGAAADAGGTESREALLARDRELSRSRRPAQPTARFVGLDTSGDALSYALEAGFLDGAVHADLERNELTAPQRAQLAGTDLIISTGCIGYVTDRTLTRVVRSLEGGARPWMAHFVLRMFPFAPVESALADLGYETVRVEGTFRQRRFASPEEQELVLATMSDAGVDAEGLEAEGLLHARLHLSRPAGTSRTAGQPDAGHGTRIPVTDPNTPNRERL